jgi:hypothetical protein
MGLLNDYFSAQSVAEHSPADALAWYQQRQKKERSNTLESAL